MTMGKQAAASAVKKQMNNPAREFETALLTQRVAQRFAMEHASPEALKKYLHEHPDADKANHTVKKQESKPKSDAIADDDPEDIRSRVKNLREQIKNNPGRSEEDKYNLKLHRKQLKKEEQALDSSSGASKKTEFDGKPISQMSLKELDSSIEELEENVKAGHPNKDEVAGWKEDLKNLEHARKSRG